MPPPRAVHPFERLRYKARMTAPEDPKPPEVEALEEEDDEVASTPFDNPFFLPAMLFLMTLWFGYDGFLSESFAEKHPPGSGTLLFNQIGAGVLFLAALWTGWRALRRRREER